MNYHCAICVYIALNGQRCHIRISCLLFMLEMVWIVIDNFCVTDDCWFVGREDGVDQASGESSYTYQRKHWGTKCKGETKSIQSYIVSFQIPVFPFSLTYINTSLPSPSQSSFDPRDFYKICNFHRLLLFARKFADTRGDATW